MKPYYEHAGITIYHADCRDVLPTLTGVDLVFADPPFNVGKNYGTAKDSRDDYESWCETWIDDCFKAMNDTATIYLMTIARHLAFTYPILSKRGVFINQVNWKNLAGAQGQKSYWASYQPILVYGKTEDYKFNLYAQRRKTEFYRFGGYSTQQQGRLLDMWDDIPFVYVGSIRHEEAILEPGGKSKAHPCQMPTALSSRCIVFSTDEGDTVLDPFMGSGTTMVSAKKLGRRAIGIEIEERYCEIAARRLSQEVLAL